MSYVFRQNGEKEGNPSTLRGGAFVFVKSESRYPINRKGIRKRVEKILAEKKIIGEVEVGVVIVGDRKMKSLNKEYRRIEETTPVLAFPLEEVRHPERSEELVLSRSKESQWDSSPALRGQNDKRFPSPFSSPDDVLRLGDIVISFPQAVQLAIEEEKLVDEKINELVEHGMGKLLGNF